MCQEDVKAPLQNNNPSWQDVRSLAGLLTGLSSDQGVDQDVSSTWHLEWGKRGVKRADTGVRAERGQKEKMSLVTMDQP